MRHLYVRCVTSSSAPTDNDRRTVELQIRCFTLTNQTGFRQIVAAFVLALWSIILPSPVLSPATAIVLPHLPKIHLESERATRERWPVAALVTLEVLVRKLSLVRRSCAAPVSHRHGGTARIVETEAQGCPACWPRSPISSNAFSSCLLLDLVLPTLRLIVVI